MATKYIGDAVIGVGLKVTAPKPLDDRTVVSKLSDLYTIPKLYAYEGMTVANIDNGNIYMLTDKSKITEKAGWRASYESIQIIALTLDEYNTLSANTDDEFNPIDDSKDYLHQDTYYYIYEDSLDGLTSGLEYLKASWGKGIEEQLTKIVSDNAKALSSIKSSYASLDYVADTYIPLTWINGTGDDGDSLMSILSAYTTNETAEETYLKKTDIRVDNDLEKDYIFVLSTDYTSDQEELATYKEGVSQQFSDINDELAKTLKIDGSGALDALVVKQIKSDGENPLVVDVTSDGLYIGDDKLALMSDLPKLIPISKSDYDALVEAGTLDEEAYYYIFEDDAQQYYVTKAYLEASYRLAGVLDSILSSTYYKKTLIDEMLAKLAPSGDYVEGSTLDLYLTKVDAESTYETKEDLTTTLNDYVTKAMLGGSGESDGTTYMFVTLSEFSNYKESLESVISGINDLLAKTLKTDGEGALSTLAVTTLTTSTIKSTEDGTTINLTSKGAYIGDSSNEENKIATITDIPKLLVISKADYEALVEAGTVDENVYYYIPEEDAQESYVVRSYLEGNYYTKGEIDSTIAQKFNVYYNGDSIDALLATKQDVGDYALNSTLTDYLKSEDAATVYETKTDLVTTLEDYVTKEMLGGTGEEDGSTYMFVTQSEFTTYKESETDVDDSKVATDSDASLKSVTVTDTVNTPVVETSTDTLTAKNSSDTLTLSGGKLLLNSEEVALDKNIPVIKVISEEDYAALEAVDENVYYYLYNTDESTAWVTASTLQSDYYTKGLVDSLLATLNALIKTLQDRISALEAASTTSDETSEDSSEETPAETLGE